MRSTAALLFVMACIADPPTGPGTKGSRTDVQTQPGTYAGYSVSYPCMGNWVDIGMQGLGSQALTTGNEITQAGNDILAALHDIPSVWGGGGYGLQCGSGVGTNVWLDDWGDVDRVIQRVGQLLHDRDLALQVGIKVEGIPVPDSN